MNSPFANIFLAIMAQIQAEVPAIKYIDHDLGDLDGYSDRPRLAFPCVLSDFDSWTFEMMGDNTQRCEGDVVIKLAFAQYGQSNSLTPSEYQQAALVYYDIEFALHLALEGWSPGDTYGYMTRTSVTTQNLPMGIRVRTIRYRLAFEDGSTAPAANQMAPPPMVVSP